MEWGELSRAVNKVTAAVAQRVDSGRAERVTPQPYARDAAQCASPFKESPHVAPRRMMDYPRGVALDNAEGRLPQLDARGMFRAHLAFCDVCLDAEAREVVSDCPYEIHTCCAIVEGMWIPWRDGPPPPSRERSAERRYSAKAPVGSEEREQADFVVESFAELEGLGVLRELSAAEAEDVDVCNTISQVSVVSKRKMVVPPEMVARPDGSYDTRRFAEAAEAAAGADAEKYAAAVAAAGGWSAVTQPELSAHLEQAQRHRFGASKYRAVLRLDVAVNPATQDTSIQYEGIAEALQPSRYGDQFNVTDGSKAYYQMAVRPEYRKYFVLECPVTGKLYQLERMPFGLAPACAIFAVPMAMYREILRASPVARGGGGGPLRA